jgi:hypothetical protein
MKSKEELVEVMARVINDVWRDDFEREYNSSQAAEAALKALCRALPAMYPNIPPELLKGSIPTENRLPDMLYNQLKQWGE